MDIVFILVEPKVPENVGTAARAMNTMGFSQMRLVGSEIHRERKAEILAHGSVELLQQASCYDSLQAALADVDFSIATTAKQRHQRQHQYAAAELPALITAKRGSVSRLAIVFGREDSGLHNHELILCDSVSSIPLAQPFPSINLGQAVMLYAYELAPLMRDGDAEIPVGDTAQMASLKSKLETLLPELGWQADEKLYRWAMERLAVLHDRDIGMLHALVNKVLERSDG